MLSPYYGQYSYVPSNQLCGRMDDWRLHRKHKPIPQELQRLACPQYRKCHKLLKLCQQSKTENNKSLNVLYLILVDAPSHIRTQRCLINYPKHELIAATQYSQSSVRLVCVLDVPIDGAKEKYVDYRWSVQTTRVQKRFFFKSTRIILFFILNGVTSSLSSSSLPVVVIHHAIVHSKLHGKHLKPVAASCYISFSFPLIEGYLTSDK